ncbi:MAG: ATP-binding protein [Pseudomonadota bacterium]
MAWGSATFWCAMVELGLSFRRIGHAAAAVIALASACLTAAAQGAADTLDYDTLRALVYDDPAAARRAAKAFLDMEPQSPVDRANALDLVGMSYYFEGRADESAKVLEQAVAIAKTAGDAKQIAGISLNYGEALAGSGAYEQAVLSLREAAELARTAGDDYIWIGALTNTFGILFEAGSYEAALTYAEQSADIAAQSEDPFVQFVTNMNVAIVSAKAGRSEAAQGALERAKSLYDYESDDAYTRLQTAYSEAFVAQHLGRSDAAAAHAQACMDIAAEIAAASMAFDCRRILTDLSLESGELAAAESYLERMGAFIETDAAPSATKEEVYSRQMAQLARLTGDETTALEFMDRQASAAKVLADRRMQAELAVAAADFLSEGADLRLSLEAARRTAAEAEAAQARSIVIAVGICLAFSLLGLGALARNLRLSRRVTEQLERNIEQRKIFARDLRHRARNNLQTIISLLNRQRRAYAEPAAGAGALASDLAMRVKAMAVLEDRLYEDGSELSDAVRMDEYLGALITAVAEAAGAGDRLRQIDVHPVVLAAEVAAPIGLIASELLFNAFKYADGADVRVSLNCDRDKDEITMIIADDGPGFEADVTHRPAKRARASGQLGLQIVRDLTDQIGGEIHLDRSTNGAVWRLTAPAAPVSDHAHAPANWKPAAGATLAAAST